MKLNEHMSKRLFSRADIPVPPGFLYSGEPDFDPSGVEFDLPWVVKAQVLCGGRGKSGGISVVKTIADFKNEAEKILNRKIKDERVPFVRVEKAASIEREIYVSFSINRQRQAAVLTVGRQGGIEIENSSETNLLFLQLDPCLGLEPHHIRQAFFHLGLPRELFKTWSRICSNLYATFDLNHLLLAEINPLVVDDRKKFIAVDGKVEIDDNHFVLTPALNEYFVPEHIDPTELKAIQAGLNFHKLDGFVGLMVNGAGLAMATMDLLNFSGLPAANFLDMGGAASEEKMSKALDILCEDEKVAVLFINIFGGILSCAKVARAMRTVLEKNPLQKPLIVRFSGFEASEAREMIKNLNRERISLAEDLNHALALMSEYKIADNTKIFERPDFSVPEYSRTKTTRESTSALMPENCRVLVQGITGREGMLHTRQMLDYGTNVVAGVTPFKKGEDVLGVPVYNTVKEARKNHGIDASIIFVPAGFAADAILEAADADIKWIVCITEGLPQQDMLRVKQKLARSGSRLIGPNTPGLIIPGKTKIGIMPGDIFTPGPVAVLSRSGTLTYESVYRLTRSGIGQSACLGIGGDPFVGSSFKDIARFLLRDPATKALLVLGEIGGNAEEELGYFLQENGFSRPLFGFIAGQTAPPGKRLGHAGAILENNSGIREKLRTMHETGYAICPDLTSISERIGRILV